MLTRLTRSIRRAARDRALLLKGLLGLAVFAGLSAGFAYGPSSPNLYSDWPYFWGAGRLALQGKSPYLLLETLNYYNPPWVAILLAPFGLFSAKFSAGMVSTLSLTILLLLCRRYQIGLFKTTMLALSPPMISILWMGQIDLLVLAGLFLPAAWWPVVAISKPQTALGLGFQALQREHIKQAVMILTVVVGVSLLIFGLWPVKILQVPLPTEYDWNIWKGIWPWSLIPGIALVLWGVARKSERHLLAASPFLMPYTTLSGFIGPWLALHTGLKDWQAAILLAVSWGLTLVYDPKFCGICWL